MNNIGDVTITTNTETRLTQELANPMLQHSLDIQERSIPDGNFLKYHYNEVKPLGTFDSPNYEILINSPNPWLLDSLYFDVSIDVSAAEEFKADNFQPVTNFFNSYFSNIKTCVGQNLQPIDHINDLNPEWGYIWKTLESSKDYYEQMGNIDLFIPDTPGQFEIIAGNNLGGKSRIAIVQEGLSEDKKTLKLRGKFKPSHLFFQKEKMYPPYVPLRISLCKTSNIKLAMTTLTSVTYKLADLKCLFKSFQINQAGYDRFEKSYVRQMETPSDLNLPVNPYKNPSALYYYFDVRGSTMTIPVYTSTFTTPIKYGSNLPKGIIFCLQTSELKLTNNPFNFPVRNIRCISVRVNSETRVPCNLCITQTNSAFQNFFMRLRNFLGANFSSMDIGPSYFQFVGGTGIMAELFNPQDSLNIHSKLEVGSIDLTIDFVNPLVKPLTLIYFLIYDQTLIIDEKGNGTLAITV